MNGWSRRLGIVLATASFLALGVSVWSGWQSREYAACQARVNDRLVSAQRAQADAVDRMVTDVLAAKSAADTRAALERYRDARAANPLPEPASQTC